MCDDQELRHTQYVDYLDSMTPKTIFRVMEAVNYLDVPPLLSLILAWTACILKSKHPRSKLATVPRNLSHLSSLTAAPSVDQFTKLIHIENDFTPAEEDEFRRVRNRNVTYIPCLCSASSFGPHTLSTSDRRTSCRERYPKLEHRHRLGLSRRAKEDALHLYEAWLQIVKATIVSVWCIALFSRQ